MLKKSNTYKCPRCEKEVELGRFGHIRPHKKGTQGCTGSGLSTYGLPKDEEAIDVTKKLRKTP